VIRRINAVPDYRRLFARVFPAVRGGDPITFEMFARALAEFDFTLTFANAPIDRYARGDLGALDPAEKRGALLFFGKAGCVGCHSVSGGSNEMFDRYRFRTPSLRKVAAEADYMHDGAFTTLATAIRHHLDARSSLLGYDPKAQGLPTDLTGAIGPTSPLLGALDPLLAKPIVLSEPEFNDLVAFVRDALLDPRATTANLRKLIPRELPSGRPPLIFELGSGKRVPSMARSR
jgi:cytochrome c peroxidase